MIQRRNLFHFLAAAALAAGARAQSIVTIVQSGDNLGALGTVALVRGIAVDDSGHVLVNIFTDNPNQNFNSALVDENGSLVVVEGDSVDPPGATILNIAQEFSLSASGNLAVNMNLTGIPAQPFDDFMYRGVPPDLMFSEGDPCTAPEVPNGSNLRLFLPPLINDSNHLCFHGVIDDPNVPGEFDLDALFKIDPDTGIQSAPYKQGDILPGQTWGIWEFQWDWGGLAFNNKGQAFFGCSTFAAAGTNSVLYIDDTKIAQTGEPSPLGGSYTSLGTSTRGLDLTDGGDYAFLCAMNSIDGIVTSGTGFVQTDDALPSIEPFEIDEFGQQVHLGEDGRVLWLGTWVLPGGGQGVGLFADYTLLVEQDATLINGFVVQQLSGLDFNYTMSPSGQYVLFQATLETVGEGAYLIDLWQ